MVMNPADEYKNNLSRQVFATVLTLLKSGDFIVGRKDLAINHDTARLENGLPPNELVATLIRQFDVSDDVGWSLMTKDQVENLITSIRNITQCKFPLLQTNAFQLMMDILMPPKAVITMLSQTKVVTSIEESNQFQVLAMSVEELNLVTVEMTKSMSATGRDAHVCSGQVDLILSECEEFATILFDLQCQKSITTLLEMTPPLSVGLRSKCIQI
eukprot:SAG22_NODE_8606_length_642_cov_0.852670_1_plen_213_part_11